MSIFKKHKKEPIEPQEFNQTNEFSFRIKISNNKDSKEVILWRFMVAHYYDELVDFVSAKKEDEYYYFVLERDYLKRIDDYKSKKAYYESKIEKLKDKEVERSELQKELSKIQEEQTSLMNEYEGLYGLFDRHSETYREIHQYPDLVKKIVQRESSFFVEHFKKHIDSCLEQYYNDFLREQGLSKLEFSRPILKNMRLEDGSLLALFNLTVTTVTNMARCYNFVYRFVERLTASLETDFPGYFVTATATPVHQDNPIHLNASSALNSNSSANPFINQIITALILYSIIITIIAIYNICNPCDDKIKKIVKEETDQIIKYEIPAQIEDAIYKEKVNCLFIREFVLPSSANIVPPTANDTVKTRK